MSPAGALHYGVAVAEGPTWVRPLCETDEPNPKFTEVVAYVTCARCKALLPLARYIARVYARP